MHDLQVQHTPCAARLGHLQRCFPSFGNLGEIQDRSMLDHAFQAQESRDVGATLIHYLAREPVALVLIGQTNGH